MFRVSPLQSVRVPPVLATTAGPPKHFSAAPLSTTSTSPAREKKQPFYKRFIPGSGGRSKKDEEALRLEEEKEEYERLSQLEVEFQEDQRRRAMDRKRNKSQLAFSDRQMLHGRAPHVGLRYPTEEYHRSQSFRKLMFGMYGARESGVSPQDCWPDSETLRHYKEYERVFYDGLSFEEILAEERRKRAEEIREREEREAKVTQNLAKMGAMVEQWENRSSKADEKETQERERREAILADLRQEYGYEIDPSQQQFAERIAEKEKEYSKMAREKRKLERAEKVKKEEEEEEAAASGGSESDKQS